MYLCQQFMHMYFVSHFHFMFFLTDKLSLDLINLEKLPSSKDGSSIRIIAQCAFKYEIIGHFLLDDKDGSSVQSITKRCGPNPEDCLRAIFRDWLQNGKERSWKRLLECLEWCDLQSVAERIENVLQEFTQEQARGTTCASTCHCLTANV